MHKTSQIRKLIVLTLYGLSLVGFIYAFYISKNFWSLEGFLMLTYIMGFYFLIETGGSRIPYYKYVIAVFVSLGLGIALSTKSFWLLLAFWLWGLGIFALLSAYKEELFNKRNIRIWGAFSKGGLFFSLVVALLSGVFWIHKYPQFNLDCNSLYSNQRLSAFLKKVSLRWGQRMEPPQEVTKDGIFDKLKLDQLIDYKGWYESLNKNLVEERKSIYIKICKSVVDEISSLYSKPSFKLSVIFMLSLVFLPFVRIMLFVMRVIGWLSFALLLKIGVYKKVLKNVKVEEIT